MELKTFRGLPTGKLVNDLDILYNGIFHTNIEADFAKAAHFENILIFIAYIDGQPAGFKLGYTHLEKPDTHYSWMGGVLENHRGHGVASALMQAQHQTCAELGYKFIETKCSPKWPAMLKLNDKFGFELVNKYISQQGYEKHLLRKAL